MEKSKAIPQGYMTVGEVAKKMGVTVRTLQYYDREGLFSPSAEAGFTPIRMWSSCIRFCH